VLVAVCDGYACWDPALRVRVRVVCARPYHALFAHNMLIRWVGGRAAGRQGGEVGSLAISMAGCMAGAVQATQSRVGRGRVVWSAAGWQDLCRALPAALARMFTGLARVSWQSSSPSNQRTLMLSLPCTCCQTSLIFADRPSEEELADFGRPDFTIYNAGAFPANRYTSYMTSETSVDISFRRRELVGSWGAAGGLDRVQAARLGPAAARCSNSTVPLATQHGRCLCIDCLPACPPACLPAHPPACPALPRSSWAPSTAGA